LSNLSFTRRKSTDCGFAGIDLLQDRLLGVSEGRGMLLLGLFDDGIRRELGILLLLLHFCSTISFLRIDFSREGVYELEFKESIEVKECGLSVENCFV
jgi:hypothetical protein